MQWDWNQKTECLRDQTYLSLVLSILEDSLQEYKIFIVGMKYFYLVLDNKAILKLGN